MGLSTSLLASPTTQRARLERHRPPSTRPKRQPHSGPIRAQLRCAARSERGRFGPSWEYDAAAARAETPLCTLIADFGRRPGLVANADNLPSGSAHVGPGRVAIAAATPVACVALAYVLWWISDRLLYVGPLDRATFGWLIVVPVWALTPVVAAFAWRPLNARQSRVAAGTVGLTISVSAAVLLWLASASQNCEFGAMRSPTEWIVPAVIVGVVIGGGFAATCLGAAAVLRRGRWWSALVVGAASAVALIFPGHHGRGAVRHERWMPATALNAPTGPLGGPFGRSLLLPLELLERTTIMSEAALQLGRRGQPRRSREPEALHGPDTSQRPAPPADLRCLSPRRRAWPDVRPPRRRPWRRG